MGVFCSSKRYAIENFKEEHEWSLWNILHKFFWLNQYQIQLKEV
jgi:hypothetical protein